jgi:D-alanyl-D-alanine carboxypeptidase
MTAIVAIEHGKLSDNVKVGRNAYSKEGSSIYLKLGEEMSLHNLLYGLMLRSGNDAATAIAEHVGGSLEGFVYLMNVKALEIGLTNTTFKNPHGLDEDGHMSSANDLAKLTAYALKNPVFAEIVRTKVKKAPNPNESWDYTWLNKNKMLSLYEGADGVKTGYTKLAKRCLVSSATRNGQQLAVVTLNDGDDWADHSRLLDYGFTYYPLFNVVNKGDIVQGTDFAAGNSFVYPASDEERGGFSMQPKLADRNSLNYRLGERGVLQIYLQGKQIGSVPLYDKDSSRLNIEDKSAFGLKETELQHSGYSQFWHFVRSLVRVMFTGATVE